MPIVSNRNLNVKVKVNSGRIVTTPPLQIRSQLKNIVSLEDLNNVSIDQPAGDYDLLQYNATSNLWENDPNLDGGTF